MKGGRAQALVSVLVFLACSAAAVAIVRGLEQLYSLESRSDAERSMNLLFTGLRLYDDFGSAIEQSQSLKESVVGLAFYDKRGTSLYSWGETPASYAGNLGSDGGNWTRSYAENKAQRSIVLLLRPSIAMPPPPPKAGEGRASPRTEGPKSRMLELMRDADLLYLEIRQPGLWARRGVLWVVFPCAELVMAALILFVRHILARNEEYRLRLEEQKNLVVLGTAASTLAHEIKNPLLAIRLQTSILAKTLPEGERAEIDIIDAEVERLSRLTTRVNDYLRDPRGFPERVAPAEIAAEVGRRLLGRELEPEGGLGLEVEVDPERLRSMLENLMRNALESGGEPRGIAVQLSGAEGKVCVDVLDRGPGLSAETAERAFDPFYTTKSAGTGIGLSICRRFAEAAGGTVALLPREGGGTRARLILPEPRAEGQRPEDPGRNRR